MRTLVILMLVMGGMMLGGCYRVEKRRLIYGDDVGSRQNYDVSTPDYSVDYLE
ncbi:hypothetical protein KS4_36240 [Poriferisphaera corsica]|uniref:Lipoprotein n=2 Tax=Poriferisphaera corsica TaxID=2528020 RepID=A0A517YZ80_9BACT|nr:hypothetical protein KS4_36240 [Poriferisphaera corsica]